MSPPGAAPTLPGIRMAFDNSTYHVSENDALTLGAGKIVSEEDVSLRPSVSFLERSLQAVYKIRRSIVLLACVIGVTQYGMVLVFGVIVGDLDHEYGLTDAQGDVLYSWMNFGACAFSFVPGLLYDRVGPAVAMLIGTMFGLIPVAFQLAWTPYWPHSVSTMQGLQWCYFFFGLSSSFFNVIGSCAPLAAFAEKDLGKVSAVVQVCLSLGLTVQSMVYRAIKSHGGDAVQAYLVYILVFLGATGMLMTLVFAAWQDMLRPKRRNGQCSGRHGPALASLFASIPFLFLASIFFCAIGFSFSFLGNMGKIGAELGLDASSLSMTFGVVNSFGRVATSVPLDFTRHHRLGGVYTYIFAALVFFLVGLLCLVLPAAPQDWQVVIANSLVALGYGGLLGIIPPALRLEFGIDNLGLIYGLLYLGVAIAVPAWDSLQLEPVMECQGISCFRGYLSFGASGIAAMIALTGFMVWENATKTKPSQPDLLINLLADDLPKFHGARGDVDHA